MDPKLHSYLKERGVREETIEILIDEELETVKKLNRATNNLLKECRIKGGQILFIRDALADLEEGNSSLSNPSDQSSLSNIIEIIPTKLTEISSSYLCSTPATPSSCSFSTPLSSDLSPKMSSSYLCSTPATPSSCSFSTPSSSDLSPKMSSSCLCSTPATPSSCSFSTPSSSVLSPKMSSSSLCSTQATPSSCSFSTPSSSELSPTTSSTRTTPTGPPDLHEPTSASAFSFAIKEKIQDTKGKGWIQSFKLPQTFPPAVNEGLKNEQLSGKIRDEFNRIICSTIMVHTMYPSMEEKNHVISLILTKYPFLGDKLGSGHNSWKQSINNWFKNKRRKQTTTSLTAAKTMAPKQEEPLAPVLKKCKRNELEMPEGETKETCKDHIKTLQKEMAKQTINRNYNIIKDLMQLTYPYRRNCLLLQGQRVADLLDQYPALQLISELKAEVGRILLDRSIFKSGAQTIRSLEKKILGEASKSANKKIKALLSKMNELKMEEDANIAGIESCASAVALQLLLRDQGCKDDLFLKICGKKKEIDQAIKDTKYPRLVGLGELGSLDPLVIAAEGVVLSKLKDVPIPIAITLLFGTFYVLNIQYTPNMRGVYAFLELVLLGSDTMAKKRIGVLRFCANLGI